MYTICHCHTIRSSKYGMWICLDEASFFARWKIPFFASLCLYKRTPYLKRSSTRPPPIPLLPGPYEPTVRFWGQRETSNIQQASRTRGRNPQIHSATASYRSALDATRGRLYVGLQSVNSKALPMCAAMPCVILKSTPLTDPDAWFKFLFWRNQRHSSNAILSHSFILIYLSGFGTTERFIRRYLYRSRVQCNLSNFPRSFSQLSKLVAKCMGAAAYAVVKRNEFQSRTFKAEFGPFYWLC